MAQTNEYLGEAYEALQRLSADDKKRLEYEEMGGKQFCFANFIWMNPHNGGTEAFPNSRILHRLLFSIRQSPKEYP